MIKFKKKYGQNFLDDLNLLEEIKQKTNVNKLDNVIEIGPGAGYLTSMLVDNAKSIICYEIDKDLISNLVKKYKDYNNIKIINQDFLESELDKSKKYKVVANIPYYITGSIIKKIIQNKDIINSVYIMVQKEVAIRIEGKKPGSRSILTYIVWYYYNVNYLFTVDKTKFTPQPKVDSAFIELKYREDKKYENMISFDLFEKYLNEMFKNKRKTLVNNLVSKKDKVLEFLEHNKKNKSIRAEEMSMEDIISLIHKLEE